LNYTTYDLFIIVASGYEYDIDDLYQEAQRRWLKPAEVMYILQNHEKYQFTQEPPQQPTSNISVLLIHLMVAITKLTPFTIPSLKFVTVSC